MVNVVVFIDLEDDTCKLLEVKELLSTTSLPIKSDKLLKVGELSWRCCCVIDWWWTGCVGKLQLEREGGHRPS